MSAKPAKKSASPSPSPASAAPVRDVAAPVSAPSRTSDVSWIDSADPRKRTWGKIILAAVWIYVAALWLLALDQTFHWGIFGPKVPPMP